jgi:two-component system chemotaxis response regulator CheB
VISVLVVDDSVVIRRLITDALAEDPGIQVVGTAANGRIALSKIEQLQPDVVTLDIEMPVLDGLRTLAELRPRFPHLPVIMFSTLTAAGANATLDALTAGASDYVTKPSNVRSFDESLRSVREQIIPRIHALCAGRGPLGRPAKGPSPTRPGPAGAPASGTVGRASTRPAASSGFTFAAALPGLTGPPTRPTGAVRREPVVTGRARIERPEILAIGCSTGGPDALSQVLKAFPASVGVPIVVVQHMPPVFTKMFAERLNRLCALDVVEAAGDEPLRPGTVYIAPGDFHLEVVRRGTSVVTKLQSGPPENFCRPAVDVLFRSVAQVYGGHALVAVLTGMGHDGKRGAELLRTAGAEIVVQDQATSVVWGMPGAIASAGLAHTVLALPEIAGHLISRTAGDRPTRSLEVTR